MRKIFTIMVLLMVTLVAKEPPHLPGAKYRTSRTCAVSLVKYYTEYEIFQGIVLRDEDFWKMIDQTIITIDWATKVLKVCVDMLPPQDYADVESFKIDMTKTIKDADEIRELEKKSNTNFKNKHAKKHKDDKWIDPTRSDCVINGGKIGSNGICKAVWSDAKEICSAAGGRLPSLNEFEKIVTDCGGEVNSDNNEKNISYQSCRKRKNFGSGRYWSSTSNTTNAANVFYLEFGNDDWNPKDFIGYVRCIRKVK